MQTIKFLRGKRWFIWAIVVIVAVLGGLAVYIYYSNNKEDNNSMFNMFKKSPKYEVVETRDFSCKAMEGFTFKYPVFKGWKVLGPKFEEKTQSCIFTLYSDKTEIFILPTFTVKKSTRADFVNIGADAPQTKDGVRYSLASDQTSIDFASTSVISISFSRNVEKDLSNIAGYWSNSQFFQTVIESFKLTK
jgi:hypothetical protein